MVEGGAWDGGMGSSGRDESQEGGEAEIGSYFLSKWICENEGAGQLAETLATNSSLTGPVSERLGK